MGFAGKRCRGRGMNNSGARYLRRKTVAHGRGLWTLISAFRDNVRDRKKPSWKLTTGAVVFGKRGRHRPAMTTDKCGYLYQHGAVRRLPAGQAAGLPGDWARRDADFYLRLSKGKASRMDFRRGRLRPVPQIIFPTARGAINIDVGGRRSLIGGMVVFLKLGFECHR